MWASGCRSTSLLLFISAHIGDAIVPVIIIKVLQQTCCQAFIDPGRSSIFGNMKIVNAVVYIDAVERRINIFMLRLELLFAGSLVAAR